MVARGKRPYYEALRTDILPVYAGLATLILGVLVFSHYTLGWQWSLSSPSIWAFLGITVLAGGCIWWGAISSFRNRTKKIFAGNHVFEIAWQAPIPVRTGHYSIDRTAVLSEFPDATVDTGDLLSGTKAGILGTDFPINVYELGGVEAHGFKSLEGGQQGYLVTFGLNRVLDLGTALFVPFYLELVDHSVVDPSIITWLKANRANFRETSPIYYVGSVATPIERLLEVSPLFQSIVLRSIGFDALVSRFVSRLENQLVTSSNATTFKAAWTADSRAAIVKGFRSWLEAQPALSLAMRNGEVGEEQWKAMAYRYCSELSFEKARHELKKDEILSHDRTAAGKARYGSRAFGETSGPAPAWDQASRTSLPTPEQ